MPRHEKFETFVKKTYQESSMEERKNIGEEYKEIEDKVNEYYEKKVSAEDFQEAVKENVEVAEGVIAVLNKKLRDANRKLTSISESNATVPPTLPVEEEPLDDLG